MMKIQFVTFLIVLASLFSNGFTDFTESLKLEGQQNSFDSLIASQCKAKCLSMYPWDHLRAQRSITNKRYSLNTPTTNEQPHQIKWHRVMELCAKNQVCLQCSLPCDIPKGMLPDCRFLCQVRLLHKIKYFFFF